METCEQLKPTLDLICLNLKIDRGILLPYCTDQHVFENSQNRISTFQVGRPAEPGKKMDSLFLFTFL